MKRKTIIFTGGGSGGHVVPAITLMNDFKKLGFDIYYIGSFQGIEKELTKGHIKEYYSISTGKLRRYLDLENLKDCFRILKGFFDSLRILWKIKEKNQVLVSMGGFVSVPVVLAAKMLGIKIVIHEQTTRVGLANKICSVFADRVYVSFRDSLAFYPKSKTHYSGYPIRDEFFEKEVKKTIIKGINLTESTKPIIFITGGGNGSKILNDKIRENLEWLQEKYLIIHQVGSFAIAEYEPLLSESYIPLAFIGSEMVDVFKLSEIIISRSGAGTVCELMALGKKSIFVPLKIAQKNEQYFNAKAASDELGSIIISEDEFRNIDFKNLIEGFTQNKIAIESSTNGKEFLVKEILTLMNE